MGGGFAQSPILVDRDFDRSVLRRARDRAVERAVGILGLSGFQLFSTDRLDEQFQFGQFLIGDGDGGRGCRFAFEDEARFGQF